MSAANERKTFSMPTAAAVVSFPKSGRTWLRVMLDQLAVRCGYHHDQSGQKAAVPFERMNVPGAKFNGRRVVFLSRDPRDALVSGYFHVTRRHQGYQDDLSSFIRDSRHGIEKVARFNLAWRMRPPVGSLVHRVTYEELMADTFRGLTEILKHLDVERTPETIRQVVSDNTFERMRAREATGIYAPRYGSKLMPGDPADEESFKVRKGKVGGYRDYLSAEDVSYCDSVLARLGYWEVVGHSRSR